MRTTAEFDLDAVRAKLDEQGMTVAGNQEASLKSRRQLADVTKSAPLAELRQNQRRTGLLNAAVHNVAGYSEGRGYSRK